MTDEDRIAYWQGAYGRMAERNRELEARINGMRTLMVKDAIAECPGCDGSAFKKHPDCESCIAAVDDRIRALPLTTEPAR